MDFLDTDLENFFEMDLTNPLGGRWLHKIADRRDQERAEQSFNLWLVEFDFASDTVTLTHDFDPRKSTYPLDEFMAAVDAHVDSLDKRT